MEWIVAPWPWYVAGPLITLIMLTMLFFGKSFGVSSTLKTVCTLGGAGRLSDYFRIPWREAIWNLMFVVGAMIGGLIANRWLSPGRAIDLSPDTYRSLENYGISNPGYELVPSSIFNWENLLTVQGFLFIIIGGFLVGFGTRYAEGCTSGHAISGLSNLQWPSLIAVAGFFAGGLIITHFVLPFIL